MQKRRSQVFQYKKNIPKMINYDVVTKENKNEHSLNCPRISDYPYRILIIGSFDLEKQTNYLA